MEPSAPPRRRTFDLPKPEAGLAEWMTKIKALQRQVDADEEAEQRRLEEEIAAARRARLRRSRGAGSGGDSMDFCESCTPTTKLHEIDHVSCTHQRYLRLVSRPPHAGLPQPKCSVLHWTSRLVKILRGNRPAPHLPRVSIHHLLLTKFCLNQVISPRPIPATRANLPGYIHRRAGNWTSTQSPCATTKCS